VGSGGTSAQRKFDMNDLKKQVSKSEMVMTKKCVKISVCARYPFLSARDRTFGRVPPLARVFSRAGVVSRYIQESCQDQPLRLPVFRAGVLAPTEKPKAWDNATFRFPALPSFLKRDLNTPSGLPQGR
jgi:hypothetical protein